MASIIKSNTYADFNGREILTANNDGALTTQKILTPYFCVSRSSQVTGQADATWFKLTFDNYDINEGSDFDTANDKFVVSIPGKYYFNLHFNGGTSSSSSLFSISCAIYKNGAQVTKTINTQKLDSEVEMTTANTQFVLDLVADDYIEAYGYIDRTTGTSRFNKGQFVGYRIGS